MADETPQRRVLPARERRESAAKRRAYSPEPAPTPTKKTTVTPAPVAGPSEPRQKRKYTKRASLVRPSTPSGASTPSVIDDVIPTKVTGSKPLPSTRQKQASSLSSRDYQSIADSAILAASLRRSRAQWLVDGVFKKYWTKPTKRKGVTDAPPNNPEQKSMQKLGNGTITIEPHKFGVSFYTVREPQAPVPFYRPPLQQQPLKVGPQTASPAPPAPQPSPAPPQVSVVQPESRTATPSTVTVPSAPLTATPSQPRASAPPPARTTSDPVIQRLAARAATDPHLKELMKTVATSKASADQLREFQGHIDEFSAVVKRQEAERMEKEKLQQKNAIAAAKVPTTALPTPVASQVTPQSANQPRPGAPGLGGTLYASYPPPPRPEPLIKHIVVEFHGEGASQDRWLFPEHAVLDIKYGDVEMTCSFFVERKGWEIISGLSGGLAEEKLALQSKWKADGEYYQPMTMLVRTNQHRTIETIARAAKVLPEVQEHMRTVMKNKIRAPEEFLVHQLPREKGVATGEISSTDFVDSAVEMPSEEEDDDLKEYYAI
jgi:hypothetical protein